MCMYSSVVKNLCALCYTSLMELEIVRADPAGNITIFVMNPPEGKDAQAQAARALMADPELKAEQVGFVFPPDEPSGTWKLRMSGDEFCGNASRSFGLLVARLAGISGKAALTVQVSGASAPLPVRIDTDAQEAEAEVPGPLAVETIFFNGRHYPLYIFEGISHAIAADMPPDELFVLDLARQAQRDFYLPGAFGTMFYDTRETFMHPVVYVKENGAALPESSCGSGSAALALWAARDLPDADQRLDIAQPGGVIKTHLVKKQGQALCLSIGGKVKLGKAVKIPLEILFPTG